MGENQQNFIFWKIHKTDKHLPRLTKRKRESSHFKLPQSGIKDGGDITNDITEMKRIMRK